MIDGEESSLLDLVNPPGMILDGERLQSWSTRNLLPTSGRLIPEFDRRRNIKDMFSKKPSSGGLSAINTSAGLASQSIPSPVSEHSPASTQSIAGSVSSQPIVTLKRSRDAPPVPSKRAKSASQPSISDSSKGQKSLKGFFAPKPTPKPASQTDGTDDRETDPRIDTSKAAGTSTFADGNIGDILTSPSQSQQSESDKFVDPIASKESWGKLFVKPVAPRCEHDEPCKTMLTKKSGVNCGRSFWMCARPLGPSGHKEKATQWRCSTFIWASDCNGVG